eukprot:Gregarina_sp_Poly_1__3349@NODE_1966_length_2979_cov_1113_632555_g1266_i0_p2_GENE_NODE_1966_length_2979_cov_1113_632555_g1266_i0NODE_1966_length_2979_cov_1113_632555_g1266_i0_p2_ORF_typecomplete_len219_score25_62S1FA/PF04689_13/0_21S1FA/PF04689_13/1_7e03SUR7/PF06687_12/0_043SUR7/PF06687_12/1_2e02YfhO/PF09586_10/0_42DUF2306/PF10067_9/2e02DUF2306/PF10067_9/1_1DUF4579/PF15158_6/56DUF4579/PF15158_6/13_NODE_1966_length_2979_cov_1113_632555_g1266_i017802436
MAACLAHWWKESRVQRGMTTLPEEDLDIGTASETHIDMDPSPAPRVSRHSCRAAVALLSTLHVWAGFLTVIACLCIIQARMRGGRISYDGIIVLILAVFLTIIGNSLIFNAVVYFYQTSPSLSLSRSRRRQKQPRSEKRRAILLLCYPCCLSRWHSLKQLAVLHVFSGMIIGICDVVGSFRSPALFFNFLLFVSAFLLWVSAARKEQIIQWRSLGLHP